MPLETEQATYDRELPNLLDRAGKYAVVGGNEVVGTYDTYDDALSVGYDRFKLSPFLVKQIEVVEQLQFFSRSIGGACHT